MLVIQEGGKPEYSAKNPRSIRREAPTTHMSYNSEQKIKVDSLNV